MTWTEKLTLAVENGARVIGIHGRPAVGKSHEAERHAGNSCVSVTMHRDLAPQELVGMFMPGADGSWLDGPVTVAAKKKLPLVINELGSASGSVIDACRTMLDSGAGSRMILGNETSVMFSDIPLIILTTNNGFLDLPEAIRSRIEVEIRAECPSDSLLLYLDGFQAGLGKMVKNSWIDTENGGFDPRKVMAFGRLRKTMEDEQAASLVWDDEVSPAVIAAMRVSTDESEVTT